MAEYIELLKKLKSDLSKLKIDHKKLKPEELNIYNLINGRNSIAQFNVDDQIILLGKGDSNKGLVHILERHYCDHCDGWLNARDIVFMSRVFKNGRKMSDYEMKEEYIDKEGYIYLLNDIKYIVIIGIDHKVGIKKVITYYTDRIAEPVALH